MGESNKTQEALKKVWEKHEENLNSQRKSVADDLKEKRKQADPFQPDVLERKAMKPAFFEWLEIRFDAATKQQDKNLLVQRCDVVKAYIDQNVPIDKCTDHFKDFRNWLLNQIEYLKNQILIDDVVPLPDNPGDDPFITSTMAGRQQQSGAAPVQDAASNVQPSSPSGQNSTPPTRTNGSQMSTGSTSQTSIGNTTQPNDGQTEQKGGKQGKGKQGNNRNDNRNNNRNDNRNDNRNNNRNNNPNNKGKK